MQLPEPPPPPLAPLWDRVLRARSLPPDLDVRLLYAAIRDRLLHPEWEVRLHALRVLADLLPISGNAYDVPFDQLVDNLGHNSPNVRKAALDALKVFCVHCDEPECAIRSIVEKCAYQNIRHMSSELDTKSNTITGLILSIPAILGILQRRDSGLDTFPVFEVLGIKLYDPLHRDVALRSLLKLRRILGPKDYMKSFSQLDSQTQIKFRILCEMYDEDSLDVHYGSRRNIYSNIRDDNKSQVIKISHTNGNSASKPLRISTDSSSDESYFVKHDDVSCYNGAYAKVIIETEIQFDADTAITMTVLEGNETETESEQNLASEEDCDSSDRNMLRYNEGDSEDTDVIVSHKRVRFGGETYKIRTPDSENLTSDNVHSDDDNQFNAISNENNIIKVSHNLATNTGKSSAPIISNKMEGIDNFKNDSESSQCKVSKKSGIPLPVIQTRVRVQQTVIDKPYVKPKKAIKQKSKSLSELYDYFRTKSGGDNSTLTESSGFALTISEVRSPEKVPSPVEPHREIEVLHNLQRSPTLSPRRRRPQLQLEQDGYVLNVIASSAPNDWSLLSPRPASPLRPYYEWEDLDIIPHHAVEQIHNTENWISAVKAADRLHGALLVPSNVTKVEPEAKSLVRHMWALSDTVPAARTPAEGAVCALVRGASADCARAVLPLLVSRLARSPAPAALPHALLQRLALHHLIDLIFDPNMIGMSSDIDRAQSGQLRAALCVARSAGPAAVLAAVRRRLAGTSRADSFCQKLRERLSKPLEDSKPLHVSRMSQLPVPVRRRARSTPPPATAHPPRKLRPLPDSAPLPGGSSTTKSHFLKPLSSIPFKNKDSSAATIDDNLEVIKAELDEDKKSRPNSIIKDLTDASTEKADVPLPPSHSPSIHVQDYSETSHSPSKSGINDEITSIHQSDRSLEASSLFGSQKSVHSDTNESPVTALSPSNSSPSLKLSRSASPSPTKSKHSSLSNISDSDKRPFVCERDVRTALAECIVPPRHEDWEVIISGLVEAERLASDEGARAPPAAWRSIARSTAGHVRSLRSRVARTACHTLGTLFESRGRLLDPELEEAAGALLERCADVNRFLRSDAASALVRVACGGSGTRAVVSLIRRGAGHRAGPVRAAAAAALAELVQREGGAWALGMPPEPRTLLLRTAGELLGDASADTRAHARRLCLTLAEDHRFRPMLKESIPPARYRSLQKNIDKLRCR